MKLLKWILPSIYLVCFFAITPIISIGNNRTNVEYHSNPEAILNQVLNRGATQVANELYYDHEVWQNVLRGIASGDQNWLKVAVAVYPGTDAGQSSMLKLSVGEALGSSPENVMRIALQEFSLKSVCGSPDIDDVRYDSYELAIAEIKRRQNRIAKVTDSDLKDICERCINYLEDSKKKIARFYDVEPEPKLEIPKSEIPNSIKDTTTLLDYAIDSQRNIDLKLKFLLKSNNFYLVKIEVFLVYAKDKNSKKIQDLLGNRYLLDQSLVPTKIQNIVLIGQNNDLEFLSFKPLRRKLYETFTLIPVKIEVQGKKDDLIDFINSVADFTILSASSFSIEKVD